MLLQKWSLCQLLYMKNITIFVKNMRHPSSLITIKVVQNFYTPIQFTNYNLLSVSCWLRGKSALPVINDKVKVANNFVKHNTY